MSTECSDSYHDTCDRWKRDALVAGGSGVFAAVVVGLGSYAVGSVGQREARVLLDSMMPTSRFLCSSVMAASATILALMLTVLSMTLNSEVDLKSTFYGRVQQIAFYDMLLLIVATCFLVVHCIPVTESSELPDWWFPTVYYLLLGTSAVMAGAMVAIVCMIYSAVVDVIQWLGLERDS